jgi:hypothetical protein
MLINQVTELHSVSLHDCCESAQQWLVPPHKGGTVEVWEGPGGTKSFAPVPFWCWTAWGGNAVQIAFCPFCGIRLSLKDEKVDLSGIDFGKVEDDTA